MSLPLDARVPDEEIEAARRAVARAKEVGEEYEGVQVATAMSGRAVAEALTASDRRSRARSASIIMSAGEAYTYLRTLVDPLHVVSRSVFYGNEGHRLPIYLHNCNLSGRRQSREPWSALFAEKWHTL